MNENILNLKNKESAEALIQKSQEYEIAWACGGIEPEYHQKGFVLQSSSWEDTEHEENAAR